MSETIEAVLNRSMRDEAFVDAFRADPETALAEYDLDDDERAALLDGDEDAVREHLGDDGYHCPPTAALSD